MNRQSSNHPHEPKELIPTRQSLLSRLKDHEDSASWQDFFNTYWKLIYGVALKSGLTEQEAQEVVQETVIAVSKKIPGFRYDPALGSFKAWLLNQTRWRILDQFRKRQRDYRLQGADQLGDADGAVLEIENLPDPAGLGLEHLWDQEWRDHLVSTAIERVRGRVNPRHYQLFDLYVNKKWPVEKIEKLLKIHASQIYLAKHRITNLLKEEILRLEEIEPRCSK